MEFGLRFWSVIAAVLPAATKNVGESDAQRGIMKIEPMVQRHIRQNPLAGQQEFLRKIPQQGPQRPAWHIQQRRAA